VHPRKKSTKPTNWGSTLIMVATNYVLSCALNVVIEPCSFILSGNLFHRVLALKFYS